jgi:hypothetical protein
VTGGPPPPPPADDEESGAPPAPPPEPPPAPRSPGPTPGFSAPPTLGASVEPLVGLRLGPAPRAGGGAQASADYNTVLYDEALFNDVPPAGVFALRVTAIIVERPLLQVLATANLFAQVRLTVVFEALVSATIGGEIGEPSMYAGIEYAEAAYNRFLRPGQQLPVFALVIERVLHDLTRAEGGWVAERFGVNATADAQLQVQRLVGGVIGLSA